MLSYGIDQQGGKPSAPTLLHESHGTPHAVACPVLSFIPGNSAKARSLGCHVESCITLGTMGGGGSGGEVPTLEVQPTLRVCDYKGPLPGCYQSWHHPAYPPSGASAIGGSMRGARASSPQPSPIHNRP